MGRRPEEDILSLKLFLFLTSASEKKLGLFGTSGLNTTLEPIFEKESSKFPGYEKQFVDRVGKRYSSLKTKNPFYLSTIRPKDSLDSLDMFLTKRLKKILYENGISTIEDFMSSKKKNSRTWI